MHNNQISIRIIYLRRFPIDLIHDVRHVGFAIIMQISYTSSRGYNEHLSHTDDLFHVY